ncbi:MAG: hypothetical protein ACE5JR_01385 [Gemmatimonadota bacterium]
MRASERERRGAREEREIPSWLDRIPEPGSSHESAPADPSSWSEVVERAAHEGGEPTGQGRVAAPTRPAAVALAASEVATVLSEPERASEEKRAGASRKEPKPTFADDIAVALHRLRLEAVETARRDADAGLPSADVSGRSESEQELRDRCSALFEGWQARERDRLNSLVARTERATAEKLGRVGLGIDRFERTTNELFRLKARWETRKELIAEEIADEKPEVEEERGFRTRWYALAIGFLGLVEFLANAPVFGALLPRDPLTERQLRLVAETSEGWLAGAARVVSQFILRPDAALLAAGVVTFLCVLAHFFGQSLRSYLVQTGSGRESETVSPRSTREHVVPMGIAGLGLALVIGVLFEARVTLGQVAENRFEQDSAVIEELRRTASWLRVEGNLVAANEQANRADDLEALATEQREYAASMSGLSFPILLLNTTLVLVAISASYFHQRDRRRERFNEGPLERERRTLIELGDAAAGAVAELLAEIVHHTRDLKNLLAERPLKQWPALVHELEAAIATFRAENGRARGLDPRAIPAFAEPVQLELKAAEEETRTLLMRDPEEYEAERHRLEERFEAIRTRFIKEATVW